MRSARSRCSPCSSPSPACTARRRCTTSGVSPVSAYVPQSASVVAAVLLSLVAILGTGFVIARRLRPRIARVAAWSLVIVAIVAVDRITDGAPAGFRMIALILAGLYAMKAVVSVESAGEPGMPLTTTKWIAFGALWFGMRPRPFASLGGPAASGASRTARHGLRMILIGLALVLVARWLWEGIPQNVVLAPDPRPVVTAIALLGLSLFLHFGVFNLATASWRRLGVDVRPLFREPLRSTSLTEFWGRRWNLAFSEMTSLGVYRPLARGIGSSPALIASFLFSGLLHELAISLPVRVGFGLPMLYFTLHAVLMTIERRLAAAGHPIDRVPWIGRAWTIAWILLPLPILFHVPFLRGVVWPLLSP